MCGKSEVKFYLSFDQIIKISTQTQKAQEAALSRRKEWESFRAKLVCQKSRKKGSEQTQNLPHSAAFLNQCKFEVGCGREATATCWSLHL